jgi:hypothetical protein
MEPRPHPAPLKGPLSPAELRRLGGLAGWMPLPCTATPRRRRFLFLGLAAPGFLGVFGSPLHQNLAVLIAGFGLFGAACLFRGRTERVFVHAEAAALWPPVAAEPNKRGRLHHA